MEKVKKYKVYEEKNRKSSAYLIAVLLLSLVMIGILTGCGVKSNSSSIDQTTPDVNPQDEQANDPNTNPQSGKTDGKQVGSGDLGKHHVEIKSALLSKDYKGNPTIVITYSWTNNSEGTTSAMASLTGKAFQDGVQLESAVMGDTDVYDMNASMKDIQPGTTLDVQNAYVLENIDSKVAFQIEQFLNLSDEKVTMDFDLSEL